MKIVLDYTRRQERPLIVGFHAEGRRYVELQEDTTIPSLLETISHITAATGDGIVAQAPRLEAAIVRCSSSTECCQEFPAADPDRSGWNPTLQVPDSASVFDLKIPPPDLRPEIRPSRSSSEDIEALNPIVLDTTEPYQTTIMLSHADTRLPRNVSFEKAQIPSYAEATAIENLPRTSPPAVSSQHTMFAHDSSPEATGSTTSGSSAVCLACLTDPVTDSSEFLCLGSNTMDYRSSTEFRHVRNSGPGGVDAPISLARDSPGRFVASSAGVLRAIIYDDDILVVSIVDQPGSVRDSAIKGNLLPPQGYDSICKKLVIASGNQWALQQHHRNNPEGPISLGCAS
ncbi:hypothetical protein MRX96_024016 [Rhipicephalus microplus]